MDGHRAGEVCLGPIGLGAVARLGNRFGGGVQGLGLDAQILRPDGAPGNDRLVAVHKYFDGNARADGVPGHGLTGRVENGGIQEGRRAVQGAVRPQVGNTAGGGMDQKRAVGADVLCRVHLGKVRVVDVHDAQGTHHLSPADARGLGSILHNLADAGGAGEDPKHLAVHAGDAEELRREAQHIRGGHLLCDGLIIVGDRERNGAGSYIGSGIHHDIVRSRNSGTAANDRLGIAEDKVPCHIHTALGIHVPGVRDLTGGVAGAVDDAGGQNLHRAGGADIRVVDDLGDGIKLHHGKGDGEGNSAAHGVGHQIIDGVRADENARLSLLPAQHAAVAGNKACLLAHGHLGVAGGNRQGNGNAYAQKLVFRVDGHIHIGPGMDVTARGQVAVDGHIGVAELQGNGVKVHIQDAIDQLLAGNESLVENEPGAQVDDLLGGDLLVFLNNNVDVPFCLVEPQLDVGIVFRV